MRVASVIQRESHDKYQKDQVENKALYTVSFNAVDEGADVGDSQKDRVPEKQCARYSCGKEYDVDSRMAAFKPQDRPPSCRT